jgi:hypothetical protein
VVFPGTGIPPLSGHIPALSSTIRGVPYPSGWSNRGGIYPIAVPVAVPAYGYGYGYEHTAPGPAPVTVVNTPPPSPAVIINQNYTPDRANPVMREYSAPVPGATAPPAASSDPAVSSYQAPIPSNPDPPRRSIDDDKPTVYLVAMKDGTVYSAYATWVERDTLHYITTAHAHNQASLELVDVRLTNQLNRERGVDFRLRQ